jgi:hypothetical protein
MGRLMNRYSLTVYGLAFAGIALFLLFIYGRFISKPTLTDISNNTKDIPSEVIKKQNHDTKEIVVKHDSAPPSLPSQSTDIKDKDVATSSESRRQDLSLYHDLIQQNPIAAHKILVQESSNKLWNRWVTLLDLSDQPSIDEKRALGFALIEKLRKNDEENFYLQASEFLNSSNSQKHKSNLIYLLKDIATPNALSTLLNDSENIYDDRELRSDMIRAISDIGENRWDRRFHTELSPILEKSWLEMSYDHYLFRVVTESIAKIGSPSGIKLLIDSLDNGTLSPDQSAITEYSMRSIRNRRNIPYLKINMKNKYDLDSKSTIASGTALAAMGSSDATKVLLDWAMNAPSESDKHITMWFNMVMRDPSSIELLKRELPLTQFKENSIKEAINAVLVR